MTIIRKAADLDIQIICPLHGPVLTENLGYYLDTYNTWSSYQPEDEGITIAYASVYGHLKAAVEELAAALEARGQKVSVFDLARDDMAEAVEDAFRYDRLVLASITYQGEIFPFVSTFIHTLVELADVDTIVMDCDPDGAVATSIAETADDARPNLVIAGA